MRSVVLHFTEVDAALEDCLATVCEPNGEEWMCCDHGDPVLYVHAPQSFVQWAEGEGLSAHERQEIERAAGGALALSLLVDVSGRHPGDAEVRALAVALLSRFRGFVMDEYTDHLWTLDEIAAGHQVQGKGFFDYRGWFAASERGPV
jgi:hypothetical protein